MEEIKIAHLHIPCELLIVLRLVFTYDSLQIFFIFAISGYLIKHQRQYCFCMHFKYFIRIFKRVDTEFNDGLN